MLGFGSSETNIKAVITAEDKASSVLKGFGDNVGALGGFVTKGLEAAAVGLAAAGAAAVAFGATSIKAFSDSEDRIAQTNAVLKSTAGVAGITANEVTKLATALERQTKFSDEDVRSVENLLLTFTSIGKDIFPQATKTVLDMATALGEDTKSASIQLGKALQDPVLGVTALRRVGVNFSADQVNVIKSLVDTGKSAQAQQLILKELNKEFGGSAEAAGNTFSGSLAKLKNQFNNLQEAVGGTILKGITPFTQKLSDFVSSDKFTEYIDKTTTALKLFGEAISGNDPKLEKGQKGFDGYIKFLKDLENVIKDLEKTGKGAIKGLIEAWDYLKPSLEKLWHTVKDDLFPALKKLWKEVLEPLAPVIGVILVVALKLLIDTLSATIQAVSDVITWVADLGEYFGVTLPGYIEGGVKTIKSAVNGVSNFFRDAFRDIKAVVLDAWNFITNIHWGDIFTGIGKGIANGLIGIIETALKLALKPLPGNLENSIHLPRFAKGVQNFGGGLAVVGEEGPEIVNLPRGANVIPNNQIGSGSGSGQVSLVVNVGLYAGSEQEKRKVAMSLLKSLQDIAGSKSTTVAQMLGT